VKRAPHLLRHPLIMEYASYGCALIMLDLLEDLYVIISRSTLHSLWKHLTKITNHVLNCAKYFKAQVPKKPIKTYSI
jgi:hypothetical protein